MGEPVSGAEAMKVSVLMPTYRHERYIAEAIESYLRQKTDFATELLVCDDASDDATFAIAKEYERRFPERVKVFRKSRNEGLMRNYKTLIDNARGEYLAVLESDDLWVDEKKLQKQVDFLDANSDFGLSFTRVSHLRNDGAEIREMPDYSDLVESLHGDMYEYLLLRNIIFSPSVVIRRSAFDSCCDMDDFLDFVTFDYPVYLSIARRFKVHYLKDITAMYRVSGSSISNNSDLAKVLRFEKGISEIRKYITGKYGSGNVSMSKIRFRQAVVMSRICFRRGNLPMAAKEFFFNLF